MLIKNIFMAKKGCWELVGVVNGLASFLFLTLESFQGIFRELLRKYECITMIIFRSEVQKKRNFN